MVRGSGVPLRVGLVRRKRPLTRSLTARAHAPAQRVQIPHAESREKFKALRGFTCPAIPKRHTRNTADARLRTNKPLTLPSANEHYVNLRKLRSRAQSALHNVAFAYVCGSGSPSALVHSHPQKHALLGRFSLGWGAQAPPALFGVCLASASFRAFKVH